MIAASPIYRTAPIGDETAPTFWNAAVLVEAAGSPFDFKESVLRPIEAELGRARGSDRNAPRTIDLDLVLFGDRVVADPEGGLTLPDPDIVRRAHLALPLADLAPDLPLPGDGRTLAAVAFRFRDAPGVTRLPAEAWAT